MTLRIHAPNPMRVGETANVLVTSDNPGIVSLVYGAGLTGPATVTIEGTRNFELTQTKEGDGWECDTAGFGKDIKECSVIFEYDTNITDKAISNLTHHEIVLASNYGLNKNNWRIIVHRGTISSWVSFGISLASGNNESIYSSGAIATMGRRYALLKVTGTTLTYIDSLGHSYSATIGAIVSTSAAAILRNWCCAKVGYYARLISDGERDAWFATGARPALSAGDEYWAGAEEQGGITYAESADANNGVLNKSATIPATRMHREYTDTVPVVPYAIVPVTAIATTGCTIDATRPRQGVPARASEAEKTETADQVTVTVEAPLVSIGPDTSATVAAYPATIPLQVCASPDGTVSLASDDALLTVPATVVISGGSGTVNATASADVTGAIITATYGATTDTATVSVTEQAAPAETLDIGPDTSIVVDAYPATVKLLVASNTDGSVAITSNNAALVPTSPVTVSGGQAEVTCTVSANVTGATVTASRTGLSDACSVTVAEVVTALKIGPSQTLRAGVTSIYLHITGEDGTCTVTSSPTVGLSGLPATVTISGGEADLTLTKMSAGTYTITVTRGLLTDTCTVVVPVSFVSSDEYDLVADVAAMIEGAGVASGNGYHYDDELLGEDGGDDEDRMFTIQELGLVDGPIIGGKTITLRVVVYYSGRAPSSDARNLMDYLNCEADAPSYVHALWVTSSGTVNEDGADRLIYEIQVSLG